MNGLNKQFFFFIAHRFLLIVLFGIVFPVFLYQAYAQKNGTLIIKADTAGIVEKIKSDSLVPEYSGQDSAVKKKIYVPRTAAIRSAVLPGLGQVYNRKYWKVPIIYAALGITGYVFFDNLKTYKEYRFAYSARYKASLSVDAGQDSTDYYQLQTKYKLARIETIRRGRDEFRRYIDYSVLVFILFWGLNVVDATVDAHLKGFDVSPDLTLKIKPGRSAMAGTNGISFVLSFRDKHGR